MVVLLFLLVPMLIFRGLGALGVTPFSEWKRCACYGMAVVFMLAGIAHFTSLKHEFAAMIPEALPLKLELVYLTGVLELAGAVGLLIARFRKGAGIGLIILLGVMLPANVNAYLNDIPFNGSPALNLWWRAPIQIVFMGALYWGAVWAPKSADQKT